jgi:hypothetical protein
MRQRLILFSTYRGGSKLKEGAITSIKELSKQGKVKILTEN